MISKRTFGVILCAFGGALALMFGKPVFKANFEDMFAVVDIIAVAFGSGLIFGGKQ